VNRERDAHENVPAVLPTASGRRLSCQIGRAFRGTFGAKTGLWTLMQSIAAKMLSDGVTEQGIAQAFETCVMEHPARSGCDSHALISGKAHSAALVELAHECVAAAAAEMEHSIASTVARRCKHNAPPKNSIPSARSPTAEGSCIDPKTQLCSSSTRTKRRAPNSAGS
jgi:hypothetical protein